MNDKSSDKIIDSKGLRKGYVAVMTNARCQNRIDLLRKDRSRSDPMVISPKHLCAMGAPSQYPGGRVADTCQGDSGGPAFKMVNVLKEKAILMKWTQAEKDRQYLKFGTAPARGELVGITSWGFACGEGTPGIYTRVNEYMDWIKRYTGEMSTFDDRKI